MRQYFRPTKNYLALFFLPLLLGVGAAPAQIFRVIDFEQTPSGAIPVDNEPLGRLNPYTVNVGAGNLEVTFGFDTNGDGFPDVDALFEKRGVDGSDGFASTKALADFDTERAGAGATLGNFFLRQPASIGNVPGTFVINYDSPVAALSAEIWDLDAIDAENYEQWEIRSYDSAGNRIGLLQSPRGITQVLSASLDSVSWAFALRGAIRRVEIEFIGTQVIAGLGFDNFRATNLPELLPPSVDLLLSGDIRVSFKTLAGCTYTVQESADFRSWTDATTDIEGTGTIVNRIFAIGNSTRRYYRVVRRG